MTQNDALTVSIAMARQGLREARQQLGLAARLRLRCTRFQGKVQFARIRGPTPERHKSIINSESSYG
jgi:hypothetical protein